MVGNPEDRLFRVDAHLSVCLNSRIFLIVLNKRTISGDKVCFKRLECRYMSSVSLTERSMSVLLHVFRYSYSSPACSNSSQDFSVPPTFIWRKEA